MALEKMNVMRKSWWGHNFKYVPVYMFNILLNVICFETGIQFIMDLIETNAVLYHLGSIWFLFHDSISELSLHYLLVSKKDEKDLVACV